MNEAIKTTAGLVLGIVGLSVVLTVLFFSEKTKVERSLVDRETHCPLTAPKNVWGLIEVKPPETNRYTAVVIDATDRISELRRSEIVDWFKNTFGESLARFERVAIYEVRPREESPIPMLSDPDFDKCAPPVRANKWIENPRLVREQFEQQFMKEMLSVVDGLASQDEARWSPIIEVLQILYEDYQRIVLVSDLMQNTPDCSLYQRQSDGRYHSGCQDYSRVSLDNKNLEVVLIRRSKLVSLQDSALMEFWKNFMETRRGTFSEETHVRLGIQPDVEVYASVCNRDEMRGNTAIGKAMGEDGIRDAAWFSDRSSCL